MIKVVDVFAGPGGLAEGFASCRVARDRRPFEVALCIEREATAHATLRLRAFQRCFDGQPPASYFDYIRGASDWDSLRASRPDEADRASREAVCLELSRRSAETVRSLVRERVDVSGPWVLIGGPPCQAYSLVGRSRNRGKAHYRPSRDKRNSLYVEYLQILADHAPPVFVMENVKGLLSARAFRTPMFERILDDLAQPARALDRERRPTGRARPRYSLISLCTSESIPDNDPSRFVVRSEDYGVPQRRHRVIVVGVRSDMAARIDPLERVNRKVTVLDRIGDLPPLRSGLSQIADSGDEWSRQVATVTKTDWFSEVAPDVRRTMRAAIAQIRETSADRGSEYRQQEAGGRVLNHSTRGHMTADLHRYLFASAFASVRGSSPVLAKFPRGLLPDHANVAAAIDGKLFGDRFRVQVAGEPSTTIASHIAKDGHYYIHYDPSQCRSLTVREAARLQTFDDDYFFTGPRTAQYHQVGNAVPPELARLIAVRVARLF